LKIPKQDEREGKDGKVEATSKGQAALSWGYA
jgi:hypothetical protein